MSRDRSGTRHDATRARFDLTPRLLAHDLWCLHLTAPACAGACTRPLVPLLTSGAAADQVQKARQPSPLQLPRHPVILLPAKLVPARAHRMWIPRDKGSHHPSGGCAVSIVARERRRPASRAASSSVHHSPSSDHYSPSIHHSPSSDHRPPSIHHSPSSDHRPPSMHRSPSNCHPPTTATVASTPRLFRPKTAPPSPLAITAASSLNSALPSASRSASPSPSPSPSPLSHTSGISFDDRASYGLGGSAANYGLGGSAANYGLGGSAANYGLGGSAASCGLGGSAASCGLGGSTASCGLGGSAASCGLVGSTASCGWHGRWVATFDEHSEMVEPTADPVADPMVDPLADPMADPMADPVADPIGCGRMTPLRAGSAALLHVDLERGSKSGRAIVSGGWERRALSKEGITFVSMGGSVVRLDGPLCRVRSGTGSNTRRDDVSRE